jgi:putative heme transporter
MTARTGDPPVGTRDGRAGAAAPRLARVGTIAWQLSGVIVLVVLTGWAVGRLMPVLLPLAIAVLLATLLGPLAARLRRAGASAGVAAAVALLALLAVLALVVLLVVPPFVARIADLGSSIEEGARQVAYSVGRDIAGMSHADVDRAIDRATHGLTGSAGNIAGNAVSGATTIATALATMVLALFLTFFLVKDGRGLWRWLLGLAPAAQRDWIDGAGARSWAALTTYVRGVVFVATVDAVFIGAALVIMGVPLALPLIVLTWIAAFFPIVGAVTAGIAAVLVTLVAQGPAAAVIVTAVIVVVQQVEGNVLYPVVVGPRLRLHPVTVLLAVAVGGTIGGIAGAFLATPVATVAAAVLRHARGSGPPAGTAGG